MTQPDSKDIECTCGEINARHCQVHNEPAIYTASATFGNGNATTTSAKVEHYSNFVGTFGNLSEQKVVSAWTPKSYEGDDLESFVEAYLEEHKEYPHYREVAKFQHDKSAARIAELEAKLKSIGDILDGIKYECYASVYTMDDDQFGWIMFCRDEARAALQKSKGDE